MKKILRTFFTIIVLCLNNSLYGMKNYNQETGTILIPKQINKNERSALHRASCKGDIEEVISLLDNGMNVNQTDHTGATPLHFAAWYGHSKIVQLLCNHGADVNLIENHGYTALKIAELWNHFEIVELLSKVETYAHKKNDHKELASVWDRIRNL